MAENHRYLKQIISLTALLIVGGLLLYAMRSFIAPFLSSVILYVILQKPMQYLTELKNVNRALGALLLMLGSFVIILLPLTAMVWMMTGKVNYVLNHSDEIINGLLRVDGYIEQWTGIRVLTTETLNSAKSFAAGIVPDIISKTADAALLVIIMYFILFFLLINAGVLEKKMTEYLPFSYENNLQFVTGMETMVMSNVMGAPLLAVIQGIFAWLGYLIFGLPEPLFWAVITALFSFIPLVGTPLVWIPAGLFQITDGHLWPGIGILIYGAVVVSNVDNVFRFLLQKKIADIHPVITLLGVIMGIKLLGLPGIVFGPLFISWFLLMVKIYRQEFHPRKENAQEVQASAGMNNPAPDEEKSSGSD